MLPLNQTWNFKALLLFFKSCTWSCQSEKLPAFRNGGGVAWQAWMGIMQRGVHKEAINSKRKKKWIRAERIPAGDWRERTAAVSLLEEVKNTVQTFSFQCSLYPHESWLHALWSTQQIPSRFPIDFPHTVCPPISPGRKERIKGRRAVRSFKLALWQGRKEMGKWDKTQESQPTNNSEQ